GRGEGGEAPLREFVDAAAVRADPDISLLVVNHCAREIARQPFLRAVAHEFALLEAVEPATIGSDPEAAFLIHPERTDHVIRQSFARGITAENTIHVTEKSLAIGADPERVPRIFMERVNVRGRRHRFSAVKTAVRSQPKT